VRTDLYAFSRWVLTVTLLTGAVNTLGATTGAGAGPSISGLANDEVAKTPSPRALANAAVVNRRLVLVMYSFTSELRIPVWLANRANYLVCNYDRR